MNHIIYNGNVVPSSWLNIHHQNKSLRYGIGCFETMRYVNGQIPLLEYHWQRLTQTLVALDMQLDFPFSATKLYASIKQLVAINEHGAHARIRLTIIVNSKLLSDNNTADYIIESFATPSFKDYISQLTTWKVGLYTSAKKTVDDYACFKLSNYLANSLAIKKAKADGFDDMLLVNSFDEIIESTIANLLLVKGDKIITPAKNRGPVNGVMLQWLSAHIDKVDLSIEEATITLNDLDAVDEIILVNAMGIKRVTHWQQTTLTKTWVFDKLNGLISSHLYIDECV